MNPLSADTTVHLPEQLAALPRSLSLQETQGVAAGGSITLSQGTLDSHAELDRRIQVDRVYRK